LSETLLFGRSPFLKKKGAFPQTGGRVQSSLPQNCGREARPNERIHFVRAGIFVEFHPERACGERLSNHRRYP